MSHPKRFLPGLVAVAIFAAGAYHAQAAQSGEPTYTELVGETLSGFPGFEPVRAVRAGATIRVAIDPVEHSAIKQRRCDVYILPSRSKEAWATNPFLDPTTRVAENLRFNQSTIVQTVKEFSSGSLSADVEPCWTIDSETICSGFGKPYDVVLDCAKKPADPNGVMGTNDFIDGGAAEAGFYLVRDPGDPLLPAVSTGTYAIASEVDNPFQLPSGKFLQLASYPENLSQMGPRPLVVISHGVGHFFDRYTHLQNHLASYGYVVMTHENDVKNGSGASVGVDAAAETTLRHTDAFLDAALGGNCPPQLGDICGNVDPDRIVWIGHSRGGNGVVFAYERLAAGAPYEYQIDDPTCPRYPGACHYDRDSVRLVSSMAPVDAQISGPNGEGLVALPGDVPFSLLWGAGDKDVGGRPGPGLAEQRAFQLFERATGPRQLLYFHGGAHGYFHDVCQVGSQSTDCTGATPPVVTPDQIRELVRSYYVPLLEYYLDGNVPALDYLWRPDDLWSGSLASVPFVTEYRDPTDPMRLVIDDHETYSEDTATSSIGGQVRHNLGACVEYADEPAGVCEGVLDDLDAHYDLDQNYTLADFQEDLTCDGPAQSDPTATVPCSWRTTTYNQAMNGMTRSRSGWESHGVVLGWPDSDPPPGDDAWYYELEVPIAAGDWSARSYLSFRVALSPRHPNTIDLFGAPLALAVVLIDGSGNSSSVQLARAEQAIDEPYQRAGPARAYLNFCPPSGCNPGLSRRGWQGEFKTVRMRLGDFQNDGTPLDLTDIRWVRFESHDSGNPTGPTPARFLLDDVEVLSSGFANCPAATPCNGEGCLLTTEELEATDTGLRACGTPSGQIIDCEGLSVHLVSYACDKAACCSTNPATCPCPVGDCPSGTYLECR